jgi:hypothetical protein
MDISSLVLTNSLLITGIIYNPNCFLTRINRAMKEVLDKAGERVIK